MQVLAALSERSLDRRETERVGSGMNERRRRGASFQIEEWHRVMKSGCKILGHQNRSAQALLRAIALDAVIAWRIMLLALLGREVPEMRCELLFNPCECEVLEMLAQKKALRW